MAIPLEEPKGYKPTGRPAGWHWRNEFVDKDGTVYHLGKEQPKLKGTLKPTKVLPPKKKKFESKKIYIYLFSSFFIIFHHFSSFFIVVSLHTFQKSKMLPLKNDEK